MGSTHKSIRRSVVVDGVSYDVESVVRFDPVTGLGGLRIGRDVLWGILSTRGDGWISVWLRPPKQEVVWSENLEYQWVKIGDWCVSTGEIAKSGGTDSGFYVEILNKLVVVRDGLLSNIAVSRVRA